MNIDLRKINQTIKEKYTVDKAGNFFSLVAKDNPKDLVVAEIGDSKQPDFYPQVKHQRWDNECNVSYRLIHDEEGDENITSEDNKIIWSKGNIEAHFYDLTEDEGGYEMEVVLKEKPNSNIIQFSLVDKDVDYFYQPELTQEEKDQGASRPENVVGSYAVYAKTPKINWKGGKEYKCGKVGHFFYPYLWDANGWKVRAEDFKIENGFMKIVLPQDFLDKAVYPVIVDPTFGYNTAGGTYATFSVNRIKGSLFTSPSDIGTITNLSAYVKCHTTSYTAYFKGIFASSSNLAILSNGVGGASPGFGNTVDWVSSSYSTSPSLSPSTNYWLVIVAGIATVGIYYDSGSSNQGIYDTSNSYASPQSPIDADYYTSFKYSIYATYTPSSSEFVIQDASSASSADNVALEQASGTFTINNADSVSSAENVALTQASGVFAIDDANCVSSAENVVLTFNGGTFIIADSDSTSSADNIVLIFQGTFSIDDAVSASSADNIDLTQASGIFAIGDASSLSSAENITLTLNGGVFEIADSSCVSSADNLVLEAHLFVILNSPDDEGTTADTTPTFNFTGYDAVGTQAEYEIQIDTVNTFNSQ